MDTLTLLARKMDLLNIPLSPRPTVACGDVYAFACLPPTAWIAVIGTPATSLVCHDAHGLACSQYIHPVPEAVLAMKHLSSPHSDPRNIDINELERFLAPECMQSLHEYV